MSKILSVFFASLILCSLTFGGTIGPDLQEALDSESGFFPVVVSLNRNIKIADIKNMYMDELSKTEAFSILKSESEKEQAFVSALCESMQLQDSVKNVNFLWIANVVTLEATKNAIHELALQPEIDVISLDRFQPMLQPFGSVAQQNVPWGLSYIKSKEVNAQGFRGQGVKVAVIDTGIDTDHPAFAPGQILTDLSKSFVTTEPTVEDGNGHGTHCAGTVAGQEYGVAPDAQIIAIKVLSASGSGSWTTVMNGVQYAAEHAQVISMSLGGRANPNGNVVESAVQNAIDNGVVVVVAAGNDGPFAQTINTPGVLKDAITVGAIDNKGELAYFSSRGETVYYDKKPDIVAPGVDVLSAWKDGQTNTISGTSMATPHVAGLIALMLGKAKGIKPEGAKNILKATANGTKRPNWYGDGTIQCDQAMSKVGSSILGVNNVVSTRGPSTLQVDGNTNRDGTISLSGTLTLPLNTNIQNMYCNAAYEEFQLTINGEKVWEKELAKVGARTFYPVNKSFTGGEVRFTIEGKKGPLNKAKVKFFFTCMSGLENLEVAEPSTVEITSLSRAKSSSISVVGFTNRQGNLSIIEDINIPVGAEILDIYCNASYEKAQLTLNGEVVWEKGIEKIEARTFYPINKKFANGGLVAFKLEGEKGPLNNAKVKFVLRLLVD